jgi:hypothetical protein
VPRAILLFNGLSALLALPTAIRRQTTERSRHEKMKLRLLREQIVEKTMFGGERDVVFQLRCDVRLDDDKYSGRGLPVATLTDAHGNVVVRQTFGDLLQGLVYRDTLVTEVIQREAQVKESCLHVKTYLSLADAFGGDDVYEI